MLSTQNKRQPRHSYKNGYKISYIYVTTHVAKTSIIDYGTPQRTALYNGCGISELSHWIAGGGL